ncbi:MAG TPA: pilus assembly protein [Firmicutes bacterium]|nr:pilus assembly protein [Bacillota bacterium]
MRRPGMGMNGKAADGGQATVEFAIVMVLFLLLLSGLVDLGRLAGTYYILANASREGARVGVLGKPDTDIEAAIQRVAATLDPARLMVQIMPGVVERFRGVPLEVSVSYALDLLMPFTAAILPNPFPLRVETVMRME